MKNSLRKPRRLALLLLLLLTSFPLFSQRLVRSIDFEKSSNYFGTDLNVGSYCGGCSQQNEAFEIVKDPVDTNNYVSHIKLKSCGKCPDNLAQSDNRGEGFVLPYSARTEITIGNVYVYEFSYFIPAGFDDWQHQNGEKWTLVSQWICWCTGNNCFGMGDCPKANPDRYCEDGGAGAHLNFDASKYSYTMKFHVDEGEGDDCMFIPAKSSATSTTGSWDRHVMEIKWADDNSGYIRWWINGKMVAERFNFRTWWTGVVPPAWKVGLYMGSADAGSWYGGDNQIDLYVDDLKLYEGISGCDACPECNYCAYRKYKIPSAPGNLVLSAANSSRIDLSWSDNSINESTFIIERKNPDGTVIHIGKTESNTPFFADFELASDVEYGYRVAAENFLGQSEFTPWVTIKTAKNDGSVILPIVQFEASSESGSNTAAKLFDGNKYSYWQSSGNESYIILDLGAKIKVSKIRMAFVDGNEREYQFKIQYSDDKVNWSGDDLSMSSGLTKSIEEYDLADFEARFVRIALMSATTSTFYMSEIQIWGGNNVGMRNLLGNKILFYPNPAHTKIIICNNSEFLKLNVELISPDGKILVSERILDRSVMDVSCLSRGFYFIRISSENNNLRLIENILLI